MGFKPATNYERKLRLAIMGAPKTGKTYTALSLAFRLAEGGKVGVIDTENASASKYQGQFPPFDVSELESYHPDDYVREIRLAEKLSYRVLIVDSLSHAWNGPGGLLEWKDQVARARYNNHGGAAWSEATPKQNRLVYTLTHARVHIIATMRTKIDYLFEKNKDGETVMTKVGLAPIQRDEFEYEFDIVGVMNRYHQMTIDGSRCSALDHCVIEKPGTEEASLDMAVLLLDWLHGSKPDQHTLLMEDLLENFYQLSPKTYERIPDWKTRALRAALDLPEEESLPATYGDEHIGAMKAYILSRQQEKQERAQKAS